MNRELDIEIAKKIYKWEYVPVGKDGAGKNEGRTLWKNKNDSSYERLLPPKGAVHEGYFVPLYSERWDLALQLAKDINLTLDIKKLTTPEDLARRCLEFIS